MAPSTSNMRASRTGLPLSIVSSRASSSARASSASATAKRSLPRLRASIPLHFPSSKARRAAATARSTSAASPSATCVSTSPVAGFTVSNVFPDAASTHSPPMNSLPGDTAAALSVVAIVFTQRTGAPEECVRFLWYSGAPCETDPFD